MQFVRSCVRSAPPARAPRALCLRRPFVRRPTDEKPVKLVRKRLDAAALGEHLRSIVAHAEVIELRVRDALGHRSEAASETLEVVARRLLAGELEAVQLRYVQDGEPWCDTVMRTGDDFRLVRMREDEPPR